MGRTLSALLWLTACGLIAILAYLALDACALGLPGMAPFVESCPVEAAPPDTALLDEQRNAEELRREVASLERQLSRAPTCRVPDPPPAPEPEPEPPHEEVPPVEDHAALTPPPAEVPLPEDHAALTPPPAEAPLPEDCPRRRPTNVLILLDASNSMGLDYGVDRALELRAWRDTRLFDRLLASPGTDRIDVARQALRTVVTSAPADVSFAFTTFNRCGRPHFHGTYPPPSRGALLAEIDGVRLDDYTALADAVAAVPQLSGGGTSEDDPLEVLLVSDGDDSCNDDPCAAARRLAAQRPHARINVIVMGAGLDSLRCIAQLTGGEFLQAADAGRVAQLFVAAAGQDLPEHCR